MVQSAIPPSRCQKNLLKRPFPRAFTLGLVVNGDTTGTCNASWGGYYSLADNSLVDEIAQLRAQGGDVIISFGGAANRELALTCTDVNALVAQYQAVIDKLRSLYSSTTDAALSKVVGITPMIGTNDVSPEVFTTTDAQQVVDFANQRHIGRIAMWSVNRDSQCPGGVESWPENTCSGVLQQPWQFSKTLDRFAGGPRPAGARGTTGNQRDYRGKEPSRPRVPANPAGLLPCRRPLVVTGASGVATRRRPASTRARHRAWSSPVTSGENPPASR